MNIPIKGLSFLAALSIFFISYAALNSIVALLVVMLCHCFPKAAVTSMVANLYAVLRLLLFPFSIWLAYGAYHLKPIRRYLGVALALYALAFFFYGLARKGVAPYPLGLALFTTMVFLALILISMLFLLHPRILEMKRESDRLNQERRQVVQARNQLTGIRALVKRRLTIALGVVLSLAILFAYQYFFLPYSPP